MALLMWLSVLVFCSLMVSTTCTEQCTQQENSYLWKVEVNPPVYFFGTMHVPYTTLWDNIPINAKTAFSGSDDLCLELKLSDKSTRETLAECQLLPRGTTVHNVLAPELIQKIQNYFQKIRSLLPKWLNNDYSTWRISSSAYSNRLFDSITSNWEKKRPIWILIMLSSLTEENIRLRNIPLLDQFLDNAAGEMGKTVQALETVDDQCMPLNRLEDHEVETALRIQLDYLDSLTSGPPNTVERNLMAYSCGNFENLVESQSMLPLPPLSNLSNITDEEVRVLQEVDAFLYNQLITRRNRRMAKKLNALLQSERDEVYYVALGAGHLIGRKNIINRLRRKDYEIQHIDVNETIEGPELPSNIIELGHPSSVPQLLVINPDSEEEEEEEEADEGPRLATLNPEDLRSLINNILGPRPPAERDSRSITREQPSSLQSRSQDTGPSQTTSQSGALASCRATVVWLALFCLLCLCLLH